MIPCLNDGLIPKSDGVRLTLRVWVRVRVRVRVGVRTWGTARITIRLWVRVRVRVRLRVWTTIEVKASARALASMVENCCDP